jgi:ankyrin repeat protein
LTKYLLDQNLLSIELDKMRQTPLYYTARDGNYITSQLLLDRGSNVDNEDIYKQTPMFYAARLSIII